MKRFRFLSILLAAALQVMPYCRTILTSPAVTSNLAIIFRWTVGASAALGAYDAVSGATTVYFTTPTNFSGTVGTYFTNFVAITNNGGDPGAFFVLTNKTAISAAVSNNNTTTVCLPLGLTFKCVDRVVGNGRFIYGAIYGTPTKAVTNQWVHLFAGYESLTPAQTNIFLTFLPAASGQAPVITNQPLGITNVAGASAAFSVVAGGTAPLSYQWRLFNTNNLLNATNPSYSITNVHLSDAGDYTVFITNSSGAVTSDVARLSVTLPAPPIVTPPVAQGNVFLLSFVPVEGLTNTVLTNGSVSGGLWGIFTNIPPPASPVSIIITDSISGPTRFYRLRVNP